KLRALRERIAMLEKIIAREVARLYRGHALNPEFGRLLWAAIFFAAWKSCYRLSRAGWLLLLGRSNERCSRQLISELRLRLSRLASVVRALCNASSSRKLSRAFVSTLSPRWH